MEDALRVFLKGCNKYKSLVLILVLMEDALRVDQQEVLPVDIKGVLILVLMEDALREINLNT